MLCRTQPRTPTPTRAHPRRDSRASRARLAGGSLRACVRGCRGLRCAARFCRNVPAQRAGGRVGSGSKFLGVGERPHLLDPLSAEEIRLARQIMSDEGVLEPSTRVAYLGLAEPPKES